MKNPSMSWCQIFKYCFALVTVGLPGLLMGAEKLVPPASATDTHAPAYDLQIVEGELVLPQGRVPATLGNVVDFLEWLYHNRPSNEQESGLVEVEKIITDTLNKFKSDGDNQDQPSFEYHPGATLLIVIGDVDSVEIARKITGLSGLTRAQRGAHAIAANKRLF